jgi:hypothetical protein
MKQSGFIFLCNNDTEEECLSNNIFGALLRDEEYFSRIQKEDLIFLYNYSSKYLWGVFIAISTIKKDVDPFLFKGQFPLQCRVRLLTNYLISLNKNEFYSLLRWKRNKPLPFIPTENNLEKLLKLFESREFTIN